MKAIIGWIVPTATLLAEFFWFCFFPLLPYIGPPRNIVHSITLENASRWIITPVNPLGQFTSFLVFDGWINIGILVFSALTLALLYSWVRKSGGWRISGALFYATNFAGLASPFMIHLFPSSNYGSWGMSSATFASLGFVFAGGVYVLFRAAPIISRLKPGYRVHLVSIGGWTVFEGVLMADAINKSVTVEAVHGASLLIGLLLGVIAFHGQAVTISVKQRIVGDGVSLRLRRD